jgi:hypothetical protein
MLAIQIHSLINIRRSEMGSKSSLSLSLYDKGVLVFRTSNKPLILKPKEMHATLKNRPSSKTFSLSGNRLLLICFLAICMLVVAVVSRSITLRSQGGQVQDPCANSCFFGPKLGLGDNFSRDSKAFLIQSSANAAIKASNECYDAHVSTIRRLAASEVELAKELEGRNQQVKALKEKLKKAEERHKETMKRQGSMADWVDISTMIKAKMLTSFPCSLGRFASWWESGPSTSQ